MCGVCGVCLLYVELSVFLWFTCSLWSSGFAICQLWGLHCWFCWVSPPQKPPSPSGLLPHIPKFKITYAHSHLARFVFPENSLIVQSRFMLLESVLIFFVLLAFFSYLRFHNRPNRWVSPVAERRTLKGCTKTSCTHISSAFEPMAPLRGDAGRLLIMSTRYLCRISIIQVSPVQNWRSQLVTLVKHIQEKPWQDQLTQRSY